MYVVRLIATVTTAHRRLAKRRLGLTERQIYSYTQTKGEIAIYCLPARRGNREGRTLSLDTRDLRGGDARSHSSSLAQLLNDRRKGTLFCAALPGQQTDIIKKSFLSPLAKGRRLRTARECLEDRPKEEVTYYILHAAPTFSAYANLVESFLTAILYSLRAPRPTCYYHHRLRAPKWRWVSLSVPPFREKEGRAPQMKCALA